MIIASFALNRLDHDRGNVPAPCLKNLTNSFLGCALPFLHVPCPLRLAQAEINPRRRYPRPGEFWEIIRLDRIGVGEAQGVTAAAVKGALEMDDFCSPGAIPCG